MASAGQASAFLHDDDFLQALDGVTDLVPLKRSVQAQRPEQQLQAWAGYVDELESRLEHVYRQLATVKTGRAVRKIACRDAAGEHSPAGHAGDHGDDHRLELLARVRAEQLMSVRLLNLLARYADLELLADPQGEAAALLDAQRRRELRARDFEESIAEHEALRQARCEELMRARDGLDATPLRVPGLRVDMN